MRPTRHLTFVPHTHLRRNIYILSPPVVLKRGEHGAEAATHTSCAPSSCHCSAHHLRLRASDHSAHTHTYISYLSTPHAAIVIVRTQPHVVPCTDFVPTPTGTHAASRRGPPRPFLGPASRTADLRGALHRASLTLQPWSWPARSPRPSQSVCHTHCPPPTSAPRRRPPQ